MAFIDTAAEATSDMEILVESDAAMLIAAAEVSVTDTLVESERETVTNRFD